MSTTRQDTTQAEVPPARPATGRPVRSPGGRGRGLRPLAVLVAVGAMIAGGWLSRWRDDDPPIEQWRATVGQEVVINDVGQSVRFMRVEVGQAYTNGRELQATGARFLLVTMRLSTPRERSMVGLECEARQGGETMRHVGLGSNIFPEPGQRTLTPVMFEFDPAQAESVRIVCQGRSTLTFRESTITFDPRLGDGSGASMNRASQGQVITEIDDVTEPIP